jgi:hypothetical protein
MNAREDENNALTARIKQLEQERANQVAQVNNEVRRADDELRKYVETRDFSGENEIVILEIKETRQELARLDQGLKVLS